MKRFRVSEHIYYLFKSNDNKGDQNSYGDVFVPRIFKNLYNLAKKDKMRFIQKNNKDNKEKLYLLNYNSYFSKKQIEKLNISKINNNLKEFINFGNNKRYSSLETKNIQTYFPSIIKTNNKDNNINNKFKTTKCESKDNKIIKIKNAKYSTISKKLNNTNRLIEIKNYKQSGYKETEKSKEEISKNIMNFSYEYNNKDNNRNEITDLESFSLKNKIELSSKKIKETNLNDQTFRKVSNNLIDKYKEDKFQIKKYNSKILKKSIDYLKKMNKTNGFSPCDYSLYLKKKIIPNLPKLKIEKSSRLSYESKENILNLINKNKIDFPLTIDNELYSTDIFYFYINRRYRNQFIKYMRHRINWEFHEVNTKYYDGIIINFEWRYYSHKVNFKNFKFKEDLPLKKLKMINLFEKNYEIGNKKNMFLNLLSYCDLIGYNVFDVVPFTLIISNTKYLSHYFTALKELIEFIPKENNLKNNILTNRKYSTHLWFEKNYQNINNQYIYFNKNFISSKNYWILKPPDLYQGKCIEIGNDYDDLSKKCKKMFRGVDKTVIPEVDGEEYSEEYFDDSFDEESYELKRTKFYCCNDIIVQKYLDNPLLYQKRKFDIRCFVLLDSNLNVYFCKEGHLKGCSEYYNLENTNKFIHITNYSFQKNSSNFEKFEIGNEISYNDFKKFMKKENIPLQKFDKMIEHMKFLIQLSLKAVSKKLIKINPVLCFQLFGYDFIVDKEFRPWILEINDNPGLGISSPVIEKIVPRMLDDAFRLTIDVVFNTKYSAECFDSRKRYKSKFKLDGYSDDENIFEFLCNLN